MFDDDEDDFRELDEVDLIHLDDDGMMEFEWMEELGELHAECEKERAEERAYAARCRAAMKAAATRRKNEWAKQDAEKKARRRRRFRSIDDPMETQ